MTYLAFLQNIGLPELIILLVIILILFGATRLPRVARSLGKSANEFKKGLREQTEDSEPSAKDDASGDE